MKRVINIILIAAVALTMLPIAAQSQTVVGLRFDSTVAHIDTLSEDDAPRTVAFRYRNTANEPVVITHIDVTCGCTVPKYSRTPIMPSAEGVVEVTFYPRGKAGVLNKNIYVYTSLAASSPTAVLRLAGHVTPTTDPFPSFAYRVGQLRLKSRTADFRRVPQGKRRVVRIEAANGGKMPYTLSISGLPSYIAFHTEPATIRPDSVGDLVFVLSDKATIRSAFEVRGMLEGVGYVKPSEREIIIKGVVE